MKTLKYAWRFLMRSKSYTIINLLGLAFSLACSIILMRYIHRELTVDTHCIDREHVYAICTNTEGNRGLSGLKQYNYDTISIDNRFVEAMTTYIPLEKDYVISGTNRIPARSLVTDSVFFQLFHYPIVQGKLSLTTPQSALLTEKYARKIFGNENPIGKVLRYSNGKDITVEGIVGEPECKTTPESSFEVNVMNVSTNFFQFMNIPLLSGHTLKAKEDLVVDKTWAERQKKDLLGTILYNYSESYTICGVCDDFIADVYNQSPGFVFLPSDFNYYVGHCYLKCEPGETADIKKMIEKTLKETLPESIHPHVTTLQEDIYEAQAIENKLKGIILFFSIVSLLITLLGVYSTITLDTERRQKEVAIRKVNGAGLKQIILLFARLYIKLLTVSAIIAFPLIYIVIQMWKKAYIVFFNDGIIYWAGIFIGITFITALTVLFRILRIAQINPAEVIKNE